MHTSCPNKWIPIGSTSESAAVGGGGGVRLEPSVSAEGWGGLSVPSHPSIRGPGPMTAKIGMGPA